MADLSNSSLWLWLRIRRLWLYPLFRVLWHASLLLGGILLALWVVAVEAASSSIFFPERTTHCQIPAERRRRYLFRFTSTLGTFLANVLSFLLLQALKSQHTPDHPERTASPIRQS